MPIKIRISIPDDVYGIREVQRITWLATYPNEKEGITKEDIEDKFKEDATDKGRQEIEERKKRYDNPNIKTYVAVDKEKIIGFCTSAKEDKNNRIYAVYVLPNYQRKGVGSLLIKEAFNWLGNKREIYLNVARYNQQAINFYLKQDFIKTGKSGILDNASKLPSGKYISEIEMVK